MPPCLLVAIVGGALLVTSARPAMGQPYPAKPIRLVVGFSAGGSADVAARSMARRLAETLQGNIVVENRAGAGGAVATQIVADANADGYTLLWGNVGPLTVIPSMGMKLGYDVERDFAPLGRTMTFANALVVRADFAAATLAEVMALAREKPGQLNFASQGNGSAGHLSGELWQQLSGIKLVHIGYKGAGDVVTSLIGGNVQLAFVSTTSARSMGGGRVRALAVTGTRRDPALPSVPTFAEQSVAGYDATFWYGMLAPARTPRAIVERLTREVRAAAIDPEVTKALEPQGLVPAPSTPQEFREVIRADSAKWKKVMTAK